MFVAMICITIRRLHDLNKSGWLCLVFLIPLVGTIFSIYVMAAQGTEGENNYGIKRPTEQTGKVIGCLYLVLMIVYLLVMITVDAQYARHDEQYGPSSTRRTSHDV